MTERTIVKADRNMIKGDIAIAATISVLINLLLISEGQLFTQLFFSMNAFLLLCFTLLAWLFVLNSADVDLRVNALVVTYLGWYLFRFPRKRAINYRDIVKVGQLPSIGDSVGSIVIWTKSRATKFVQMHRYEDVVKLLDAIWRKTAGRAEVFGVKMKNDRIVGLR